MTTLVWFLVTASFLHAPTSAVLPVEFFRKLDAERKTHARASQVDPHSLPGVILGQKQSIVTNSKIMDTPQELRAATGMSSNQKPRDQNFNPDAGKSSKHSLLSRSVFSQSGGAAGGHSGLDLGRGDKQMRAFLARSKSVEAPHQEERSSEERSSGLQLGIRKQGQIGQTRNGFGSRKASHAETSSGLKIDRGYSGNGKSSGLQLDGVHSSRKASHSPAANKIMNAKEKEAEQVDKELKDWWKQQTQGSGLQLGTWYRAEKAKEKAQEDAALRERLEREPTQEESDLNHYKASKWKMMETRGWELAKHEMKEWSKGLKMWEIPDQDARRAKEVVDGLDDEEVWMPKEYRKSLGKKDFNWERGDRALTKAGVEPK